MGKGERDGGERERGRDGEKEACGGGHGGMMLRRLWVRGIWGVCLWVLGCCGVGLWVLGSLRGGSQGNRVRMGRDE
ncbi:unnamed protein product [Prunus armeniaca]|uniref:Uncharacterized protein n=1 Tax=Prunus armeniaca TaxID=36596 RepID=A0A6J5UDK1_PRUAR|nr:unnamed protein product [Prunus armeniaca]